MGDEQHKTDMWSKIKLKIPVNNRKLLQSHMTSITFPCYRTWIKKETLNNSFRNISPSSFSCISFKWLKKSRVQVKASDVLCKWKTSYKGYRDISTNSQIYIIQLPAQPKFIVLSTPIRWWLSSFLREINDRN
jgi:hypothetical protein